MPRTAATARTLLVALVTIAVTVLGAGGPTWASAPRSGRDAGSAQWSAPVLPIRLAHGFAPPEQSWLSGHRGIDLRAPVGSEVRAVDDGVVVWAGELAGMPVVSVQHDGGLRSTYQPVEATVAVGQSVLVGDLLGQLSDSGSHCAPASCLHLGAKRGPDAYLDPALLLGLRGPRLLPYLSASTVPHRSTVLDLPAQPPRPGQPLSPAPSPFSGTPASGSAEGSAGQVIELLVSALAAIGAATVAT